jgi:hypothetical protein
MEKLQKLYSDIFNTYSPETVLIYLLRQVVLLTEKSDKKDPEFVLMADDINLKIENYLKEINSNNESSI